MPLHAVTPILFEDQGDKTQLTSTSLYESLEDLEGMLQSGAEHGAAITWNRLEELLATLRG